MKTIKFEGKRVNLGNNIVRVYIESDMFGNPLHEIFNLPLYLNEVNHSPTGFEWGYGGSGPAQLSYAILRCFCRNFLNMTEEDAQDWAREHYYDFKSRVISQIDGDTWEIPQRVVENFLSKVGRKTA